MSRPINGRAVVTSPVTSALVGGPPRTLAAMAHTHAHTDAPACPKGCDVATPAEHAGGARYVCTACGTEFSWKGGPS